MSRLVSALCSAIAILVAAAPAAAAVFDLKADWSDVANPNGVWTYREGSNALPSFSGGSIAGDFSGEQGWAPGNTAGNHLPAWFKADTAPGGLDVQIGDIVVHTTDSANGPGRGVANVIWTAPSGGTAHIFGDTWDVRDFDRTQQWEVYVDGILQASGMLDPANSFTRASPATFDVAAATIDAGDLVEFRAFLLGNLGDYLGVNLTVDLTPPTNGVPEPGTLTLVGAGILGLGLLRRRRRR